MIPTGFLILERCFPNRSCSKLKAATEKYFHFTERMRSITVSGMEVIIVLTLTLLFRSLFHVFVSFNKALKVFRLFFHIPDPKP